MTKEDAKKLYPIIQAFSEGKTIEYYDHFEQKWGVVENPVFGGDVKDYRIKSQPTYRPFNDAEECWNEMQKHQPFGWVKAAGINIIRNIASIENDGVAFHNIIGVLYNYKEMMKLFSFMDGAPFSIKETE